jgi:hypothetical protein
MIDSISDNAGAYPDLKRAKRRKATARELGSDRLPPHAPEAEAGVLGCVLLAPNECLDQLDEAGMQAEWFYDLKHQLIYHTARAMHLVGQLIALGRDAVLGKIDVALLGVEANVGTFSSDRSDG